MRKNVKVTLVLWGVMVMVLMVIGNQVAVAAAADSLTVENNFASLGEATQYGVVAREWDQKAHAETNACVDVLDRHSNTVFSNTESTYFHALGYKLEATVTAPQSLKGMTFALYKQSSDGTSFVKCDGTKITVIQDVKTTALNWDIDGQLGMLKVTASDNASALHFKNSYAADGEIRLEGTKKVVGCETADNFAFEIRFYHQDGTEVTEPMVYTGDRTGELYSGDLMFLGHGQSITFTGLLPGMCYTVEAYVHNAYETKVNALPMNRMGGVCEVGGNRADFVNTLKMTTFSVRKTWQGEYGGDIILTLYANGEKMDPQPMYTRDGDTYLFTNLPMYDADGDLVVYSAKERYMDGYLTIYDNVPPYDGMNSMIYDGGTIINRSVTSIRVRKLWNGLPEGNEAPVITLTLYCNGEKVDRMQPKPDENGWYVYKNLPRYVNGEEAFYYVIEDPMDGFMPIYTDTQGQQAEWAGDGYTITNHLMPATGDDAPVMLWAMMLAASSALLLVFKRRRKVN